MMNTNTQHREQAEQVDRQVAPTPLIERAALASITDGVIVNDVEGQVTTLNRAAACMLQVNPDAVLGRPVNALFEPFSATDSSVQATCESNTNTLSMVLPMGHPPSGVLMRAGTGTRPYGIR